MHRMQAHATDGARQVRAQVPVECAGSRVARATTLAAGVAVLLGACATTVERPANVTPVPATLPSGVERSRVTDRTIAHDLAAIETYQSRVRALNDAGRPIRDYGLAKAQCWVSFALDEYHDNDRTGVVEAALLEADRLLDAMEAGAPVPRETPIVATSTRLREDLWARAASLQQGDGARCATAEAACLEVQLVWAGHEYRETGWRHARHAIDVAERLAAEGDRLHGGCPPLAPPAVVAAASAPAPATPAPATAAPAQRVVLGADALFAIGRSDLPAMRAEGRRRLDALGADLSAWTSLDRVVVLGHADRLGTPAANQRLSEARARTVKDYLAAHGVPADRIVTGGRGDTAPLVQCANRDRGALVECLQPNRRVEIEVFGAR